MKKIIILIFILSFLTSVNADNDGGGYVTGADPDGPYSGLVNTTIQFYGSVTGDDLTPPYTWEWDFDYDGTNFSVDSTQQNPTHVYLSTGNYTVALRVTDSANNTSLGITYAYIYKQANIRPIVDFVWRPRYPEVGELVKFTDLSIDPDGNIVSWVWDFGNGDKDTSKNPTTRYDEAGTYVVVLKVRDNDGDASLKSAILKVYEEEMEEEKNYTVILYFLDMENNTIEGVNVEVFNSSGLICSLISDEYGKVKFNASGNIKIKAKKHGYMSRTIFLNVNKDMSVVVRMKECSRFLWWWIGIMVVALMGTIIILRKKLH